MKTRKNTEVGIAPVKVKPQGTLEGGCADADKTRMKAAGVFCYDRGGC